MEFVRQDRDGASVVVIKRRILDLATAKDFKAVLDRKLRSAALLLDLAKVEYLDSVIIGVLVERFTAFRGDGKRLILYNLQQGVQELLRTTNLIDVFDVCADEAEALILAGQSVDSELPL